MRRRHIRCDHGGLTTRATTINNTVGTIENLCQGALLHDGMRSKVKGGRQPRTWRDTQQPRTMYVQCTIYCSTTYIVYAHSRACLYYLFACHVRQRGLSVILSYFVNVMWAEMQKPLYDVTRLKQPKENRTQNIFLQASGSCSSSVIHSLVPAASRHKSTRAHTHMRAHTLPK